MVIVPKNVLIIVQCDIGDPLFIVYLRSNKL